MKPARLLPLTLLCAVVLAALAWAAPADATTSGARLFALTTSNFDPFFGRPASGVEIVDLASRSRVASFSVGDRAVSSLAVSPDGETLYIPDQLANEVAIYAADGTLLGAVPTAPGPRDSVLSADGSVLYVATWESVVVIDTSARRVIQTVAADTPLSLALAPDGAQLAVVSTQGGSAAALWLFPRRASGDLGVGARIAITNPGEPTNCTTNPNDVAYAGARIVLWDSNCDNLYQVDPATEAQRTEETIRTGRDSGGFANFNNELVYSPVSRAVYVPKENSTLLSLDVASRAVQTVEAGQLHFVTAVAPDGLTVYASVIHRFAGGGADTLDAVDVTAGGITRVYTFSTATQSVRDMKVVSGASGQARDLTAPVIECAPAPTGWSFANVELACTAGDGGSGLADPADASFTLATSVPLGSVDANASTGSRSVCDNAGNCAVAGPLSGIRVDRRAPVVACEVPDAGWHASNVTVACTASDGGAGLADPADASFTLATSVPLGSVDASASTGSRSVCDGVGNCATASPVSGIKVDRSAPRLSLARLTAAADGFVPALSTASFPATVYTPIVTIEGAVSDTGSGVATLNGAAFAGGAWTRSFTLLPGANTLTFTATDNAGNSAAAVTIRVSYMGPDADGDGIANNVDGDSSVTPARPEYLTPSFRFSDRLLGGVTSGQIVTPVPTSMSYTVADAASPSGVRLVVNASSGKQLRVTLDGKRPLYKYSAGSYLLTDPEATGTTTVISGGPAEIELDVNGTPLSLLLYEGATVSVTDIADGTYTVTALEGTVTLQGEPLRQGEKLAILRMTLDRLNLADEHFEFAAAVALGSSSNGIDPTSEDVVLIVGAVRYPLAPGVFRRTGNGGYEAQVTGAATKLHVRIRREKGGSYRIQAEGAGDFRAATDAVTVTLRIGDDAGSMQR